MIGYVRVPQCYQRDARYFVAERVSREDKAIGIVSVNLFVCLFPRCLLNRLIFDLEFCM